MKQAVREYETSDCHCERSEAISLILRTFKIASSLRSSQRHYTRTDWKERLFTGLLLLIICVNTGFSQSIDETNRKQETWLTPSAIQQLYIEGLDDRKGLGRIFVPAMTNGVDEPRYAVFKDEELIGQRNMGESFFLKPGNYTVVLGTGSLDQRIHIEVDIGREETVILEPNWSALTLEVIDRLRNYLKQDLHLYRVETTESFGIIPAINPELGEHLQTLILRPGYYKIVKRGEDFNTYVNFATIYLEPGSYTPYTIVIDIETGGFIGAGLLTAITQLRQRRNWRLFGVVHGRARMTSANDETSREVKTNLALSSEFENRLYYDRFPHYYLSNNLLELGALRQEGAKFVIDQDRLQLKNTYVYYLLAWLGGYARFVSITHLFPTILQFDELQDVTFLDLEGKPERLKLAVKEVKLAPSLFPLRLKEGLGVNVTLLQTFISRLSLRTGFGFRQTYNRDVYQQSLNVPTEFRRVEDNFRSGPEMFLVSNFAVLRNLVITTDIDVFFPFGEMHKPEIDLENFITLGVTKNVTVEHRFRLERTPTDYDWTIQDQFVSVRFSYYLF